MNNELLLVLDYIEREKGINREVLASAIESALLSAAKKRFGETNKLTVSFDNKTGEIEVLKAGKPVRSLEFGRIAAQTAKQIITQKIREAEREVIFNEFQTKVGEITNGTVHRFEKGNLIIDLGKTEGVLSHKELLPKEEFRQGDRVRALIVEVKRTNKGPQIRLSRTDAGFVKRLFELEVPEIYEGIVEIRSIAREAGERTKVAVWSKEEKVDCIGACVGVRGSRIKNIVRELHGEKVDIVRWHENADEYLKAALSPAKISQIEANKESKTIDIVVEDDQLSLAIGKRGQNIRLASRLLGWVLNVKSKTQIAESKKIQIKDEKQQQLNQIEGVGKKTLESLIAAGFDNIDKVAQAKIEELTKIKGVGKKRAEQIIVKAKEQLKSEK